MNNDAAWIASLERQLAVCKLCLFQAQMAAMKILEKKPMICKLEPPTEPGIYWVSCPAHSTRSGKLHPLPCELRPGGVWLIPGYACTPTTAELVADEFYFGDKIEFPASFEPEASSDA